MKQTGIGLIIVLMVTWIIFGFAEMNYSLNGNKYDQAYYAQKKETIYEMNFDEQKIRFDENDYGLYLYVNGEEKAFYTTTDQQIRLFIDERSIYEIYVNDEKIAPIDYFEHEKGLASIYALPLNEKVNAIDLRYQGYNLMFNQQYGNMSEEDWNAFIHSGQPKASDAIEDEHLIVYRLHQLGQFDAARNEFVFEDHTASLSDKGYYEGTLMVDGKAYQLNQSQLKAFLSIFDSQ